MFIIAIAASTVGCGGFADAEGSGSFAPQARDATPSGGTDAGTMPPQRSPNLIQDTRIREDFDSLWYVDASSTTVAIVDVNRGQVSLPAEVLPVLRNNAVPDVTTVGSYQGVVEANAIIVGDTAMIEGTDSVELRARGEIRISGRVRAGPGGVTLIAGRAISIDGVIESEGPVRLRLAEETGRVEITGSVLTLATNERPSPSISILGRGSVTITGILATGEARFADSGGISIGVYGPIVLSGNTTSLTTGASLPGRAGSIELSTESTIDLLDGASILAGNATPEGTRPGSTEGGSVRLRASGATFGDGVRLRGGAAVAGDAGDVEVTASDTLITGSFVEFIAGDGVNGGDVKLASTAITLGPNTASEAGAGTTLAGRMFMDSAGNVDLQPQVRLRGGRGDCQDGGPLVVLVGGRLILDATSRLLGGPADFSGQGCLGADGGDVQIFAQQIEGPIDDVVMGGTGLMAGEINVQVDAEHTRPVPDIRVRTIGWVISKVIDRGESARPLRPCLLESRIEAPPGTFAKVQLAKADSPDGKFAEWIDAVSDDPKQLEPIVGARYVRYRVWLKGRALDTPVVDGFDLDLAPRD